MAQVITLACDKCGKKPAETWELRKAGTPLTKVDLCPTCAKPLKDIGALGRSGEPGKRKRMQITPLPPQPQDRPQKARKRAVKGS